jgi:aminopeptidase
MSFTYDQYLDRYADLLITYCLEIRQNDRLLIKSSLLAEPLVRRLYAKCLEAGGHPHFQLSFSEQNEVYMDRAEDHQLNYVSPFFQYAMEEFEAYLVIRAPYNLSEGNGRFSEKNKIRGKAMEKVNATYFKRTATKDLKRSLCQFPTQAAAQFAGMTLSEYRDFIFNACHLKSPDPMQAWLDVREKQQSIVDQLNTCSKIRYKNPHSDIVFSTKGRSWINSDGQTNMPSGEVYTAPVEDDVNGHIYFDLPTVYRGKEVEGVRFEVEEGEIVKWSAKKGQDFLDEIFELPGARRFGEAAIGTNYNIQQTTGNILFDEKIGGTIHMAIGQAYPQAGGQNKSSVHWDMIANMKDGGQIYADDQLIYENGQFLDW